MTAYYEALLAYWAQQEAEAAQHAAVQAANSWRVDHPAARTDQEGLKPTVRTYSAIPDTIWNDLYYSDFYLVSRSMQLFEAYSAPFVELFTGENRGLLTGNTPTQEQSDTIAVVSFATLPFGGYASNAPKAATGLSEGRVIIERIARGEYGKGIDYLKGFLTQGQLRLLGDARTRAMAIGTAVHKATEQALEENFPGRFEYFSNKGMDFLDKTTGELVELTTRAQQAYKQWKYGAGADSLATY
jgi:hypothetical protein